MQTRHTYLNVSRPICRDNDKQLLLHLIDYRYLAKSRDIYASVSFPFSRKQARKLMKNVLCIALQILCTISSLLQDCVNIAQVNDSFHFKPYRLVIIVINF